MSNLEIYSYKDEVNEKMSIEMNTKITSQDSSKSKLKQTLLKFGNYKNNFA